MRKLYKIVICLILLGVVAFTPMKTSALSITTQPLYAGQHIQVGEVNVWNDSDNLYVQFLITESDWQMTEAHLFVGDMINMPVTKTGNPQIGLFPYKQTFTPAVSEYTFVIDHDDINSDNLIVAAHAVVEHFNVITYMPEVNWMRNNEDQTLAFPGFGGNWDYADVTGAFPLMDSMVWDNSLYDTINPYVGGVDYASWLYRYNHGGSYVGYSDLRLFKTNFMVPAGFNITAAKLGVLNYLDRVPINDNVYVYINGDLQYWGGTRANVVGTHEGMVGLQAIGYNSGQQLETDGWYISGTIPALTHIQDGLNTLEVFTEENERWGGMGKLILTLEGRQVDRNETAWGAGVRIAPKGNWATYFNYTWQL